jgi:nucleotide-binding universal stress UspA family protein
MAMAAVFNVDNGVIILYDETITAPSGRKLVLRTMRSTGKGGKEMVPQIKKILYATDLTANSAYAAYFALDLAHKYQAKIVILHCTETFSRGHYGLGAVYMPPVEEVLDEKRQAAEAELKRRLGEFYRKVGSKITPDYARLVSDIIVKPVYAVEEILNTADAEERTRKPMFIIPLPSEKTDVDWDAA